MNRITVNKTKHRHLWELHLNNTCLWITTSDARHIQWDVVAVIRTGHPATVDHGRARQLTITETPD
jgi:hypothetical protein